MADSLRYGALAWVLAFVSACSGGGDGVALADESILQALVPGTSNSRIESSSPQQVTRLMDVTGDWNRVSVDLARLAREHGWDVTSVNCVGTGNDVVGYKQVDGEARLLESGAGTRGAGIIVSATNSVGSGFSSSGRCPLALVEEAQR